MKKNHKIIVLISVFLAVFASRAWCEEGEEGYAAISLTLNDSMRIAFKNNKDIQIQEQELDIAKANILGARSLFLPNVDLSAGYTRNGAVLNFGQLSQAKKDMGIFTGYKNDNQVGLTINESIYNGGANIANFNQAKLGLNVSSQTLRAKKLDVEFEAKRLYYGLLLAYETERITQDLVDQAQAHYENVKQKYAQGTSSRFDVLQSKVQVSKFTPELVKAKNAVNLIAADLKKLLGFKMQVSVKLKDTLTYSPINIKERDFLSQAYLGKPEMILRSLGIDISRWSIEMARSGWRPQVNANAGYSFTSNNTANMLNNRHNLWNIGVSVTIPLFDGFSTKAKVDEAKAKYEQANLEKENLSDQIAVEVRRACLDLQEAEAIIGSQKDNIEEAKEALRIAGVSYDNGVGTNLDILDAQVSLSQIEQNLAEGIYDYQMAHAYLDRTMGKSFIEEAKNEKY